MQRNERDVRPVLDSLVETKFFKYFRVNLEKECPFWFVDKTCGLDGGCEVCECDAREIPLSWQDQDWVSGKTDEVVHSGDGDVPDSRQWCDDDCGDNRAVWVNLRSNPEVNTGFVGPAATRVWSAIYKENCFQGGALQEMCYEERVFYRIVSGIHSSTTAHIFQNFHKSPKGCVGMECSFSPNLSLFNKALGRVVNP